MNETLLRAFQYWGRGGPLLVPIAFICFVIWIYFLNLRRLLIHMLSSDPGVESEIWRRIVKAGDEEEIIRWLSGFNDLVCRIAAYTLSCARRGGNVREALKECREAETSYFERELLILKALVACAPLLGLLGTILGMISTFQAVADKGAGTAHLVAAGISQALITTQFGLIVALPGVFAYSYLKRKCAQLEVRLAMYESHLVLHVERRGQGVEI